MPRESAAAAGLLIATRDARTSGQTVGRRKRDAGNAMQSREMHPASCRFVHDCGFCATDIPSGPMLICKLDQPDGAGTGGICYEKARW